MVTLLSADIGGTSTRLRLSAFESGVLSTLKQTQYRSADWASFDAVLEDFLKDNNDIYDNACFAVAGPLVSTSTLIQDQTKTTKKHNVTTTDTQVNVTNLPWKLSTQHLKEKFNLPQLSLVNDFEAIAHSVDLLCDNDLLTMQQGQAETNNSQTQTRAFIGAGTGLGQAISVFNGSHYDVISTEGGHCDFAPNNNFEVALYQFLNQKHKHVSYERLLSGEGLVNIYQFFCQICQPDAISTQEEEKILSHQDKALAISQMAKLNCDGLADRALDLFFRIYGSQCGNLALSCLPTGGLYIAGGIAQKNLQYMIASDFLNRFNEKGRMTKLMENIPVKIITTSDAGLLGATNVALKASQKTTPLEKN